MLKLKDSVRLATLVNNFGFKPKFDEDTGEIVALVFDVNNHINEDLVITRKKSKTRLFRIFRQKYSPNKDIWVISKYQSYFNIDILYELIKADLIERIEE